MTRVMRLLALCLCLSGCSFAFVKEPTDSMLRNEAPLTCTTSRALPTLDLAIGTLLGSLVFITTYAAVEELNEACSPGRCYPPWGPALIGSFLVVSPWGISSAVGFSDTHQCRNITLTREPLVPPAE